MPSTGQRILFIKPSAYDRHGRILRVNKSFFPSRTLPYLAACTPGDFALRFIDEAVQEIPAAAAADLVVLTGMLPNVPRAIEIGRMFRQHGAQTIIGGIGVFSLYDTLRASGAFDAVVHGESENIWPAIMEDFRRGDLKSDYTGTRAENLAHLPPARYDLVDFTRYWRLPGQRLPFLAIETSRGCPHNCSFCAIRLYFGQKMRFRPVGDVVEEMRQLGARYYILTDDNIMANPERAAELFQAIKPLNVRWGGQFDVNAIRHPDVLRLAAESGCRFAGVGIESINPENLAAARKYHGQHVKLEDVVRGFREAGIAMAASMIFGMDHDTPESLDETVTRVIESGADFMLPWVLTPGPGCAVYDQFKAEGRLRHENYSLYNGVDVVFQPKNMSPEQLDAALKRALKRFYSLRHAVPRSLAAKRKLDVLGMNLFFWAVSRSGQHPFCGV